MMSGKMSVQQQAVDKGQSSDVHKRLRELTFLHETSQVLTATLDLDAVLHSLLAQVRDYFRVAAVSVALLDEETGELAFRVAVGEVAEEVIGTRLPPGQGVAGWVVETGETAYVSQASDDERFFSGVDERTGFQTSAMLAVPIKVENRSIGVIEAINPSVGAFDDDAQRLLLSVADLSAVAIRNAALYERALGAERRYESLFDESSDPILVLDMEGRILNLNKRARDLFGFSRDRVIGADLCAVLNVPLDECSTAIQKVIDGQQPSMEVEVPSDGGITVVEARLAKIDYGGREAIQWLGHDISEQVALERMREDLTHMIIHDLRNPLGSMMSSLQLVRTAFVERDQTLPVLQLINIAMRSGEKLYHLIDSLLDLRRMEVGDTDLNKTLFSPGVLVKEALEQMQPQALSKNQAMSMNVSPDLPYVFAERNLILRVLTNLLENAVKFTPERGRIEVSVAREAGEVAFGVSDTGPGVAPEHRQRIFERFTRLENAEGLKGTGLGLAFCRLAVEGHGGRIWVEGEESQGSHFKFTLPLSETSAQAAGASSREDE